MICGDARRLPLADGLVQCVVTSPPYWGLRKYAGEQELVWGGQNDCEHEWTNESKQIDCRIQPADFNARYFGKDIAHREIPIETIRRSECLRCKAWQGAYGLEPVADCLGWAREPMALCNRCYVCHTVLILREIRRVLRDDGVVFWNLGDSYAASGGDLNTRNNPRANVGSNQRVWEAQSYKEGCRKPPPGLKPKDLCLIPQRVALAAQRDGWWVRSDIIWAKPNPMPESCKDRPTDAYEHILMLTKSKTYFWDAEAVAEPSATDDIRRPYTSQGAWELDGRPPEQRHGGKPRGGANAFRGQGHFRSSPNGPANREGRDMKEVGAGLTRNLRNVWTFPTQPYKGAHFATFPEELPRRCILAATKPGNIVLDPFAGSGTGGRVAIQLGRRAVLLDLAYGGEKGYGPLARQRTSTVQVELI